MRGLALIIVAAGACHQPAPRSTARIEKAEWIVRGEFVWTMVADEDSLYFLGADASDPEAATTLSRMPASGGEVTRLAKVPTSTGGMVAIDTNLYIADEKGILRASKQGADAPVLWLGAEGISSLATDGERIFYAAGGTISSVAPDAPDAPRLLARTEGHVAVNLAVGETHVFWSPNELRPKAHGVFAAPKDGGGAVVTLARDQDPIARIMPRGDSVYWLTIGSPEAEFADGALHTASPDGSEARTLPSRFLGARDAVPLDAGFLVLRRDAVDLVNEQGAISRSIAVEAGATLEATSQWIFIADSNRMDRVAGILRVRRP